MHHMKYLAQLKVEYICALKGCKEKCQATSLCLPECAVLHANASYSINTMLASVPV